MPLIKLNDRSIKDVTSLPVGVGNLIHINSQTASNSASISFTTGINSTYKEYQFYFINIHPVTDNVQFQFNMSTDGGSNYNVTKTTTMFRTYHLEDDSYTSIDYSSANDLAQSTSFQPLNQSTLFSNASDENLCGVMSLFNPSSTTYVKHFIHNNVGNFDDVGGLCMSNFVAGYGNTTSAINAIQFKMSSGNIDGTIAMFGVL
jgi:hypothetical protein